MVRRYLIGLGPAQRLTGTIAFTYTLPPIPSGPRVRKREIDIDLSVLGSAAREVILRQISRGTAPRTAIAIDDGVLRAFLTVKSYRQGARSLNAIVAMCPLADRRTFDRSRLPAKDQLGAHVDAKEFLALSEQGWS